MPTGVPLADARERLFAAAERVLTREGASALTSRAVTDEAGVAKGVLHRHFADFDAFLAELVDERSACIEAELAGLREAAGSGPVAVTLARALAAVFDPVTVGIVALVVSRAEVRARLRVATPTGIPVLVEATRAVADYLRVERSRGRILPDADVETLALALVGTGYLLFAGETGALSGVDALAGVVATVTAGVLPVA